MILVSFVFVAWMSQNVMCNHENHMNATLNIHEQMSEGTMIFEFQDFTVNERKQAS